MKRIHIVGASPRTGTTLLAEAMITCFNIDLYTKHEDQIFKQPAQDGNIFLTKAPRDITVVAPFLWVMPDLYVIYMLRDPRDIITSKHYKNPERYWVSLRFWKTYTPFGRKLKNHPRFITIRYEDLVSDPDQVQVFLLEKLTFLSLKARFSQFHEVARPSSDSIAALRGVRPISATEISKWRHHLSRVAGQLLLHGSISQDLIEFGYEVDDSWLKELEGVEPDMSESHLPDSKAELRQLQQGQYKEACKALLRQWGIKPIKLKK